VQETPESLCMISPRDCGQGSCAVRNPHLFEETPASVLCFTLLMAFLLKIINSF